MSRRTPMSRQLFLIGAELLNSLSVEEVEATYADMVEMDIAKPPYAEFDVRMPLLAYAKSLGRFREHYIAELARLNNASKEDNERDNAVGGLIELAQEQKCVFAQAPYDITYSFTFPQDGAPKHDWFMSLHGRSIRRHDITSDETIERVLKMFCVLLATRNVTREVKTSKLAKLGIGKNSYSKTTTLRIGNVTELQGSEAGIGVNRRPHLRRGHIRRQKYGPGFQFEKKIFVQAVFVNADEDWIAERTAYNVSRVA